MASTNLTLLSRFRLFTIVLAFLLSAYFYNIGILHHLGFSSDNKVSEMPSLAVASARHSGVNLAGKVAVVVGGTSGIGAGIALRLAQADASVVLVGRSRERAEQVMMRMRAMSKTATHTFVSCDASLVGSVVQFSREFAQSHTSLDYLVLTQGIATFQGRTETVEGLDVKMSLHYYSRVAFMRALAPLLDRAPDPRVLTVLSAGVHSPFVGYASDPDLKTTYSLTNAANAAGFYNDIAVESMALEHPHISFTHAAPGIVKTNWGRELPTVVRGIVRVLQLFFRSLEDCGEYMSSALIDEDYKGGWHLMGAEGQHVRTTPLQEQARESVWAHTQSILDRLMK